MYHKEVLITNQSTGRGNWLNVQESDKATFTIINSTSANCSMQFIGLMLKPSEAPSTSYASVSAGTTSLPVFPMAYRVLSSGYSCSTPAATTVDCSGTVLTRMYQIETEGLTHLTAQIITATSTGTSSTPMVYVEASVQ
jgi:hypothetical protein